MQKLRQLLAHLAVQYADAVVMGSEKTDPALAGWIAESGKPVLPYAGQENYEDVYAEFYDKLLEK